MTSHASIRRLATSIKGVLAAGVALGALTASFAAHGAAAQAQAAPTGTAVEEVIVTAQPQ